jgi:demethoxyubiquinone hydroxylase (CLK1/Coq7/Cat5 family)
MNTNQNANVDQLNSFLRGEMSAVETYRQAVAALKQSAYADRITECMRSHEERVRLLEAQVQKYGGTPAKGSGPWGAFAKLVEKGASALGDKAAITVLEEGEDHGLRDYRADLSKLDEDSRRLIQQRILPEQQKTHAELSDLKRRIH